MPSVNIEYKDRLFSFLFGNEENREWTLGRVSKVEVLQFRVDLTAFQGDFPQVYWR